MEKNAFLTELYHISVVREETDGVIVDMYFNLEEGTKQEYIVEGEQTVNGWYAYGWRLKVSGQLEEAYRNFASEKGYILPEQIIIASAQ